MITLIVKTKNNSFVHLKNPGNQWCNFCGKGTNPTVQAEITPEGRVNSIVADICESCARQIVTIFEEETPIPGQTEQQPEEEVPF